MEIKIIKNGREIINDNLWFDVAPPKDRKRQWKNGRSAKELARFATDSSFKEFIKKILKDAGIKEQDFHCEPEAKTSFGKGMGKGGPRNHDLLMIGDNCVIGIEAKVSESFGNAVKKEWEDYKKVKRITGLLNYFSKNYTLLDSPEKIPYQLLTATVGTVLEAIRKGKKKAIVLVLVFTGNVEKEKDYSNNCRKNNAAFNAFEKAFFDENEKPKKIQEIECGIYKREVCIGSNYDFKVPSNQ